MVIISDQTRKNLFAKRKELLIRVDNEPMDPERKAVLITYINKIDAVLNRDYQEQKRWRI